LVARSKGGQRAKPCSGGGAGGFFAINSPPFHCSVLSLISTSKLAGDRTTPPSYAEASCILLESLESNKIHDESIRATVTARQSPWPCVPKQCSASQGRQACRTCTEQRQGVLAAPARPRAVSLRVCEGMKRSRTTVPACRWAWCCTLIEPSRAWFPYPYEVPMIPICPPNLSLTVGSRSIAPYRSSIAALPLPRSARLKPLELTTSAVEPRRRHHSGGPLFGVHGTRN
jgi:hypothetical protein